MFFALVTCIPLHGHFFRAIQHVVVARRLPPFSQRFITFSTIAEVAGLIYASVIIMATIWFLAGEVLVRASRLLSSPAVNCGCIDSPTMRDVA